MSTTSQMAMDGPSGVSVPCPSCHNAPIAVVPKNSKIVEEEEDADGKVWVYCRECGEEFLAYYRIN